MKANNKRDKDAVTRAEMYLQAREQGMTNKEIALQYGVKVATVERAIGKEPAKLTTKQGAAEKKQARQATAEPNFNRKPPDRVLTPRTIKCTDCGNEFTMAPSEQKFYLNKGYKLPKRCEACRTKRASEEKLICVDCGKEFAISNTNRRFYESKGLMLPRRCSDCLKYKRERNRRLEEEGR